MTTVLNRDWRSGPSKAALIVLFSLIALPVLAFSFWTNQPQPPDNLESEVEEELLPPPARLKLEVPPAMPETPPPAEDKISSASASQSDAEAERARLLAEAEEARRSAEAERLARESESDEKKWERYRSPMLVIETGQSADMMA